MFFFIIDYIRSLIRSSLYCNFLDALNFSFFFSVNIFYLIKIRKKNELDLKLLCHLNFYLRILGTFLYVIILITLSQIL